MVVESLFKIARIRLGNWSTRRTPSIVNEYVDRPGSNQPVHLADHPGAIGIIRHKKIVILPLAFVEFTDNLSHFFAAARHQSDMSTQCGQFDCRCLANPFAASTNESVHACQIEIHIGY